MKLTDLGFNKEFDAFRAGNIPADQETGRVVAEHKERYIVKTAEAEFEAEITGHMRFTAKSREDFPAVGDWVSISIFDPGFALIHTIFPRFSIIRRQSVGKAGEIQLIAANIDFAFIVQAAGRDFNINRLERYLAICNNSRVEPIIVLTKTDLHPVEEILEITGRITSRIQNILVLPVSNQTLDGYEKIKSMIRPGKTYCMLGSSGVGKSSLLNNLTGKDIMKTGTLSDSTHKGKHVTSHRELIVLEGGGILVDNPGMREVGIADAAGGLEITFDEIHSLSKQCRFTDCKHTHEAGCAVLEAVENCSIDRASYENYLKLEREKTHYESTLAERRRKDKEFGKMMKNYKKGK